MAELVLGAFLPLLIDKLVSLTSPYLRDFIHSVGVDELLDDWSKKLQIHRDLLEDAEEKQLTNKEVKRWLDDLHDLLYDVDDFVDELAYEAQARQIKSSNESRASTSRFPDCISAASLFNNCGINLAASKFYRKMKPKIEEISRRLQGISQRRDDLGLKQINILGRDPVVTVSPPLQTTTSLPPTRVFGRAKEKEEIVEMLMKPEAEATQIPVITILGMGGMGKTTLAQDVYHDKQVQGCFDLKAWVCVSVLFDVADITRAILKSILGSDDMGKLDLNQLQEKLKQMLSGKKFLLVLDDIWNENYGKWELLIRPFPSGPAATGSRILATARNETVAATMSLTGPRYQLRELGEADCLSLLASHALERNDFAEHLHLKECGEQIVKKCGRLPLAIKTVAGLLRSKRLECEWKDIINSNKWTEDSDGILPALRLSYYHLPSHLKRCFSYCSIIPKDHIFDRNELVSLWMAEGLLQQPTGGNNRPMEDFGRDCFQELLSRSFLQLTSGSTTEFIMHDLINDLAVHVAGKRYFRMDNENREYNISERTRHLSFIGQSHEVPKKFNVFKIAHRSRTFLPLPPRKFHLMHHTFYISDTVLALTLSRLQYLRVLNLKNYCIVELQNSIGANLKHLRYLNLSYTGIEQMPQFVCSLYNLQTLSLKGCTNLRELPSSMVCLTNLRHLDLENTRSLEKMPSGIGKLTSLQTLSKIIVGRDTGSCNLKDLKDLIHLHGTLSIEELHNVTDEQDAVVADLRSKEHLEILKLQWRFRDSTDLSHDKLLENRVLEKLQPHCNLKELHIKGYGGVGFPSWVGGQSMSNMVKIHLCGCFEIIHLPPLGELPLLKELVIEGLGKITSVGAEFYGSCAKEIAYFPSLETLRFCKMTKWNVWSPPVACKELFPRLRDLKIDDCRELGSIPTLELPCLHSLKLMQCSDVWLERLVNLISLKKILIEDVVSLTCLPEQFVNSLVSLEEAKFESCDQLGYLWRRNNGTCLEGPFNRLNSLSVWHCRNLISLLGEGEQGLPSNLKVLMLYECANLEKLPNGLHGLTSLQEIHICGCPSLVWDVTDYLPSNLKVLMLYRCANLEKLPNWLHGLTSSLQEIEICDCPSLVWDVTDRLPKSLEKLTLRNCPKLESSITFLDDGNHSIPSVNIISLTGCTNIIRSWSDGSLSSPSYFASLVELSIGGCPGLESFSVTFFPTLRDLEIHECADLKSLPDGIQGLASLEHLGIFSCGNLGPIGDKDLPPSLINLIIENEGGEGKKEKLMVLSDWGFHSLTSLRSLNIEGFKDVVFSNSTSTSYLFPPSLTVLGITSFPNLESLSKGLQNLTSLRHLFIRNCPNLESLSNSLQNLTSLRDLSIYNCPKLESLAGADDDDKASLQIISSLNRLIINGESSEVFRKRCKKEKGKYWPTIQHIPQLEIEDN